MLDLEQLIDIIELEKIDDCLFIGNNYKTAWKRVFGGQVLAQALNAAYNTVPDDRIAHSLHGYFILGGDIDKPIVYTVSVLRDGGSFTTRRVTASQNGKAIFIMAASFQLKQDGFDHQSDMPDVKGPEKLKTDMEQAESIKLFAPSVYKRMKARHQTAIEFRPVERFAFENAIMGKKARNVWMKVTEKRKLSLPMQHQLLAYASDYDLLLTALYPHRSKVNTDKLFIASLDHAMWFHRDFDFTDWLLFEIDSPSASNSRGMGYGNIYTQDGKLVSTVIQEGLMRNGRK